MKRRRRAARETTPPPRPARPSRAPEVLLAAFTFLVYCASFPNALTNWDDPTYVSLNGIAAQGWSGLGVAFTRTFDGAYYPLTQVAYTLVQLLFGGAPAAYHVAQAALFAIAVALVPAALAPFGVGRRAAVAAALLWAVHPLRVESVVWAANLKDTLAAPLVVASFALYGRGRRWQAAAAFAAALLAKSMFFPLAVLFPVADGLAGHRPLAALKRSWSFAAIGAAIAVASGALYLSGPGEPLAPTALGVRLSTALWTPWWYLGRLAWPAAPQAVYDFALVQPWSGRFFAALALWAAFAGAVWRSPPAVARAACIAAAAFVLPLLPVGGLVSIKYAVADRYTLFPSLAACAALAAALALVRERRLLVVATAALLAACAPLNVLRQREWRSAAALWEANASAAPDLWTVRANLADAYSLEHRWGDATREMDEALRRHPEHRDALSAAFFYHGAQDGLPSAELEQLSARLQKEPSDDALVEAAEWALTRNGFATARFALEHAWGLGSHAHGQRLLAVVDRRQGRLEESASHARRALDLGEAKARIELVFALADLERWDEALALASAPLPDRYAAAQLRGARAYALIHMGRRQEGEAEARAAWDDLQSSGAP